MGSYRSQPDKAKFTFSQITSNLEFAVCHMCGMCNIIQDGDSIWKTLPFKYSTLMAKITIFLVFLMVMEVIFSSFSGAQVAIFTQKHFVQELLRNQNYNDKNYELAFQQTFEKIDKLLKSDKGNRQIKNIQNQLIKEDNLPKRDCKQCAGSTALVCLLTEDELIVSNAGDCQAYAQRNGSFISLNHIHQPKSPNEKQRIFRAGGYVSEQGRINDCLNVSRAIGDIDFKNNKRLPQRKQMVISLPQVRRQNLEDIEYILMGCDGIWEEKSPLEIQQFVDKRIKKGYESCKILQEMFEWLICKLQEAQDKQFGKDNMSAILIRLNHDRKNHKDVSREIKAEEIIQF